MTEKDHNIKKSEGNEFHRVGAQLKMRDLQAKIKI